jgi:MFS family permease
LAEDKKLVCLMASVCAFGFTGAMIPNLAIHARHVCRAPESFLGDLLSWQMVGAIAGCLIAGWCGDRSGSKMPLQVGRVLFLVVCIAAPIASSVWAWRLLFLAFGAAFYACAIGSSTIQLEILPSTGRASRLAIMSANQIPVTIAASLAGGLAWKVAHEAAFPWLAAIAAVGTAASIIILIKLPEPRTATKELLT